MHFIVKLKHLALIIGRLQHLMPQASLKCFAQLSLKILRDVAIRASFLLHHAFVVANRTDHWPALILAYEVLLEEKFLIIGVCLFLI